MSMLALVLCAALFGSAATADDGPPAAPVAAKAKGKVVADSNFRPKVNGYSFANYANDEGYENLTVADMRRLFGEKVCASVVDGRCILLPTAQQWMDSTNESMKIGHCFGFATTAQLFFMGKGTPPDPDPFGAPTVPGLEIQDNPKLQSHIAYGWTFQNLPRVRDKMAGGKPGDIVALLRELIRPGKTQAVLLLFDDGGGHAITPYAVRRQSKNRYDVLVYDNNWPDTSRAVHVDLRKQTWKYELGPGTVWKGTAKSESMLLEFPKLGLGKNPCFFCKPSAPVGQATSADASPAARERRKMELRWSGDPRTGRHGSLFIRDEKGNRSGCGPHGCINHIPGVDEWRQVNGVKPWELSPPPIFRLPQGRRYLVTLAGNQLEARATEGIDIIGAGFSYSAEGIRLKRGERNHVVLSKTGRKMIFLNDREQNQTPTLGLSTVGKGGAYAFEIKAHGVRKGALVAFAVKPRKEKLLILPRGQAKRGRFELKMTRYTQSGKEVLRDTVKARSGVGLLIDYGKWTDDAQPAPARAATG